MRRTASPVFTLLMLPIWMLGIASAAPLLEGKQLVDALTGGGYVMLMRHASSPDAPPSKDQTAPGNVGRERQLDDAGRASARAMGDALRKLKIPIGKVVSSTAYRALQTAREAQFPEPRTYDDLSEVGKSAERTASVRAELALVPDAVSNTVMISQNANIADAVGTDAKDLAAGEALVYRPDGRGKFTLVARVKIEDWAKLASAH